jgi:hypothetical protein
MIIGHLWKYYGIRGDEDLPTGFQRWMTQWYPQRITPIDITEKLLYLRPEQK